MEGLQAETRRPNGGLVGSDVVSEAVHRQGGFRRPGRCVIKEFGAARDHGVAAPTQAVCQPLHTQRPARSVLKMKRG
jgi:hypothetical protein